MSRRRRPRLPAALRKVSRYRKAAAAAVTALTTAAALGLLPAPWDAWVPVLLAVAGVYGVYRLPNDPPPGRKASPGVSERDRR